MQLNRKKQRVLTGEFWGKNQIPTHWSKNGTSKKATEKCQDKTDKTAKGFCFSLVHQGVLKCLSNSSVPDMYETAY